MQKVYLLLRSNQQTGPFSLEELLQFDLKPFDLIWIEGRSAGWYYPQEIPALQPHLSFLKKTPETSTPPPVQESVVKPAQPAGPKKVFVSMPSNASKEEPTPKPSFSEQYYEQSRPTFPPSSSLPKEEPETLKTTSAKSLEEVETDYTNWMYQTKTKKKPVVSGKGILIACLFAGSAFAAWSILQPDGKDNKTTSSEQTAQLPVQNELVVDSNAEIPTPEPAGKTFAERKQSSNKKIVVQREEKQILSKPSTQEKQPSIPTVEVPEHQDDHPTSEVTKEETVAVEENKSEPAVTNAPKEKKKLKEKIADLFRKKPEEKKEDAKPVEEENGERRSVRREAGSSLSQMVTLGFEIPNDWMMGIKGAKATLTNRSSETIAKAVVEVVYYNDDNDVLDKRTITFSNIKSKQKQTVSVPDHQTATRLEYNVISATGAGEPFAKR